MVSDSQMSQPLFPHCPRARFFAGVVSTACAISTLLFVASAITPVILKAAEPDADPKKGDAPRRPEKADPAERLREMSEKLGLSAEQQAKLREAIRAHAPAIRELMGKGRGNLTEADKGKLRELLKEQAEAIRPILTEEQRKKFDELAAQRRRKER